MRKLALAMLLAAVAVAFGQETEPVLLAAGRGGRIEVHNPHDLQLIGTIAVNHGLESLSISPDGHRLYLAQEMAGTDGCCRFFSMNTETHGMCGFSNQGVYAMPTPDGRYLIAQREDGIEMLDASNLARTLMKASGKYNLQSSPDGRWLFGITNSPKPAIDVFDMQERRQIRKLAFPTGPITGAWAHGDLQVISYAPPGKVQLWTVQPEYHDLGEPQQILLRDLHGACDQPVLLTVAGGADHLFLAEAFGFKMDRRQDCPSARGGIYALDPTGGNAHLIAPEVRVNRMIASPDGHDLYVLQSGESGQPGSVRLLRMEARTGNILASVPIIADEWSLVYARIPRGLVPHGYVRAALSCAR